MVININYEEEILKIMKTLDDNTKKKVLNFVKTVSNHPQGELGQNLVKRSRELNFDQESLREMEAAIEEACEVIEDFKDINLDD